MSIGLAEALWITAPGRAELRPVALRAPGPGEALVRADWGGISRGTEALVLRGGVPEAEHARMRCPHQEGEFPFPVKYGYAQVGVVEAGPDATLGRSVFCLHPHQDRFVVPVEALHPVPGDVPPGRAVLAANMETALNGLWDGGPRPGDRIAVVGAGVVGALAAYLCGRIPGTETTLVDIDPSRAALAAALGVGFAAPEHAPHDCDLVFHASASAAGLATAIGCAGFEARVIELSWYGNNAVLVPLGGAYHAGRIKLVSSQVGSVAESRRARWSHGRRMDKAISLLADGRLDALLTGATPLRELPDTYPAVLGAPGTLCHRVRYDA
ncbi:MDR/zinc-dependent alcohol dehydrogenase-like family protein [Arenibaculum pallidiluteum]|uniref:dehydrogenase n=1 Tax=Arenibaculum pallidiluteum TaxID=2812559 RepID=UPI001A9604E0|nr:dehydrogenase [Arenibaculum pallidiluteum]